MRSFVTNPNICWLSKPSSKVKTALSFKSVFCTVLYLHRVRWEKPYLVRFFIFGVYLILCTYHDCVTRRGIVVIDSQYCSMYGITSSSLSNRYFSLPFFWACCCKFAIAVTHICEIAVNFSNRNLFKTKSKSLSLFTINSCKWTISLLDWWLKVGLLAWHLRKLSKPVGEQFLQKKI